MVLQSGAGREILVRVEARRRGTFPPAEGETQGTPGAGRDRYRGALDC